MIGHTDEMECSELTSMTLEGISDFNDALYRKDSADTYHHALFLIDSDYHENKQQSDDQFWRSGDDFLSVTRIHFPNTINHREQFKKLTIHFEKLSSKSDFKDVFWKIYYTMELSDMILVSKSSSLGSLSKWALLATNTVLVGNSYTYFCVPGTILDRDSSLWPKALKKDIIDFVSIRFSVQSDNVEDILSNTRNTLGTDVTTIPFRIAGNEDAILCGFNVPTQNLIRLYQSWYQSNTDILKLFKNIITRIGTAWKGIVEDEKSSEATKREKLLEKYSKLVLDKVSNNILVNDSLNNREWLRPLVELTNGLVHMSRSASLDEPVLLILPALNAFWDNVIDPTVQLTDETMYLRFSELCIHTMEHLMRAEGQLSQRPEMRPLTYDLPVFVLEYATAFLLTLGEILTVPDGNEARKIRFLLVPSAETDVSTEEPFIATSKTAGLLQTTIPFSLLYNPKHLLAALCHEMAHYVGEKIRMRKFRYTCFLRSASTEMIRYFFSEVTDNENKLQEYISESFLNQYILTVIDTIYDGNEDAYSIPLLDIVYWINHAIEDIILNEGDGYTTLARDYVLSDYNGAQFSSFPQLMLEDHVQPFAKRLDDLATSYREAYADICMLYILKLPPVDYLEVALHRWDILNTGMYLRAYLSLSTAGYNHIAILEAFREWGETKQVRSEMINKAHKELNAIEELIHSKDTWAEHYLVEYLQRCWEEFASFNLDKKDQNAPYTVKEIYDQLVEINRSTEYNTILDVIDYGRQITLRQLKNALNV